METGTGEGAIAHLECRDLHKAFGSTTALDGVSLAIRAGSVHALVGENGAGKSTLGKIIAGVFPPDGGEIVLRGTRVAFAAPRQALDAGIALVAQELVLVPQLTVAENVYLGVEPARAGFIDRRTLADRYERLVAETGFALPPDVLVGALPIAQQQQVEIMRALARNADLIVLDEPTAALSGPEARRLHDIVRTLSRAGRTVVLISHILPEVLELADTVTILRDGRIVRTDPTADETETSLIAGMLGRPAGQTYPPKRPPAAEAPVVLRVRDLVAPGVGGVSFDVRAGEIVGLAGLVGAGRSELARAIFGAATIVGGSVTAAGARWDRPAEAIRAGVVLIPESRKTEGLFPGRPVRENVSLTSLHGLSRAGFVRRRAEDAATRSAVGEATVAASIEQPAGTLSGGNQQKLLFARALLARPRLLLADEPTRGVDVGAKRSIYELLVGFAADGTAILLISSEMEEVLGLAHRVIVMAGGRIASELSGEDMSENAILRAAFSTADRVA